MADRITALETVPVRILSDAEDSLRVKLAHTIGREMLRGGFIGFTSGPSRTPDEAVIEARAFCVSPERANQVYAYTPATDYTPATNPLSDLAKWLDDLETKLIDEASAKGLIHTIKFEIGARLAGRGRP